MLDIKIKTIPHSSHRYDTSGDYYTDGDGVDHILVSDLGDWRKEILIVIHEIVEFYLCKHRGIKEEDITAFDIASGSDDPGLLPDAPYHTQHIIATGIEMLLADHLGVKWSDYEKSFDNLKYGEPE